MSKSGIIGGGRGRGWLSLQQKNNTSIPAPTRLTDIPISIKNESEFTDVNDFPDVINRVKELDITDDGIKFNQKIRYILDNWIEDCPSGEEVEKSFDALYEACLNNDELASKLVLMIASRSFMKQEVRDQNIRSLFLRKLQNDFEGCKTVQKTNPTAFRNSIRMLGEFYNKAKLTNGLPFTFMVAPLLAYLEMLLESTQVLDLQQFASQIYLNGSSIKSESPDKLNDIFNKVRAVLASDKQISKEGKLWLLLSLEISGNKFGMLPIDIFKFYQEEIGSSAMAFFQGAQNTLIVHTPEENKTLDNYQSSVNVLQLSTKPDAAPVEQNIPITDTSSSFTSTSSLSDNSTSTKDPKCGRPILGVGARLNKNSGPNNWKERDSAPSGRGKSGWRDRTEKTPKNKTKGWEHDDRFENNYS